MALFIKTVNESLLLLINMDVFLVGLSASWKNTSVNCGDMKKKGSAAN